MPQLINMMNVFLPQPVYGLLPAYSIWLVNAGWKNLDSFTISLHSPNDRQFACYLGCARRLSSSPESIRKTTWPLGRWPYSDNRGYCSLGNSKWNHVLLPLQKTTLVFRPGFNVETIFAGMGIPVMKNRGSSGPRLNIKTICQRYGDSHVKDKMVGETVSSLTWESLYW